MDANYFHADFDQVMNGSKYAVYVTSIVSMICVMYTCTADQLLMLLVSTFMIFYMAYIYAFRSKTAFDECEKTHTSVSCAYFFNPSTVFTPETLQECIERDVDIARYHQARQFISNIDSSYIKDSYHISRCAAFDDTEGCQKIIEGLYQRLDAHEQPGGSN